LNPHQILALTGEEYDSETEEANAKTVLPTQETNVSKKKVTNDYDNATKLPAKGQLKIELSTEPEPAKFDELINDLAAKKIGSATLLNSDSEKERDGSDNEIKEGNMLSQDISERKMYIVAMLDDAEESKEEISEETGGKLVQSGHTLENEYGSTKGYAGSAELSTGTSSTEFLAVTAPLPPVQTTPAPGRSRARLSAPGAYAVTPRSRGPNLRGSASKQRRNRFPEEMEGDHSSYSHDDEVGAEVFLPMDSSHLTTSLAPASNHNDTNEEERTIAMAMPVSECDEDEDDFEEEDEEGQVNLSEAVVVVQASPINMRSMMKQRRVQSLILVAIMFSAALIGFIVTQTATTRGNTGGSATNSSEIPENELHFPSSSAPISEYCGSTSVRQQNYQGTINHTIRGSPCQDWSSQEPRSHSFTPEQYPNDGLQDNYCRNPNGTRLRAWCLSYDDSNVWFQACEIPTCGYCGTDLEHAQSTCSTTCTTTSGSSSDSSASKISTMVPQEQQPQQLQQCPKGQLCFQDTSCEASLTTEFYCGFDWKSASESCQFPCSSGLQWECPLGQTCFSIGTNCDT
jgi:hypothetical protein